jgi:hypothetical protein
VGKVFHQDSKVGHWSAADKSFVHVGIKGELLNILVFTDFDKLFASFLGAVPKPLQESENHKDAAVVFHKGCSGLAEALGIAGSEKIQARLCGEVATKHGVINALA